MWTIDREATAMRGRIGEYLSGILVLAAAWVLAALPAHADNSGRPMTFEWGVVYGDQPAIFADGDFTPETPAAFRSFLQRSAQPTRDRSIYFNSLGGDLSAGMEVGRLVRRAELNTGVARNTRDPAQANLIDLDFNSRSSRARSPSRRRFP
jgi:hypothetical protein